MKKQRLIYKVISFLKEIKLSKLIIYVNILLFFYLRERKFLGLAN